MMHAIIFVPGYKGSFLRSSSTGQRVWLQAKNAIFPGHSLAYDLSNHEIKAASTLEPDKIFDQITFLRGLYSKDVYHSWFSRLSQSRPTVQLIPFAYDWRADYWEQVSKLDQLISGLKNNGIETIDIIAHSLGGLIAAYYLRYGIQDPDTAKETWAGAHNIRHVVFAAVPFRGTLKAIYDLAYGEVVGFNRSLLHKSIIRTFPVAYELLPSGRALIDREERTIDLFSVEKWQQHRLGLLNEKMSEEDQRVASEMLFKMLNRSKILFDCQHNANSLPAPQKLKVLNLVGNSLPTPSKMYWNDKSSPANLLDDLTHYADGDGTVTCTTAQLPKSWASSNTSINWSSNKHIELFRSRKIQNTILEFLASL